MPPRIPKILEPHAEGMGLFFSFDSKNLLSVKRDRKEGGSFSPQGKNFMTG